MTRRKPRFRPSVEPATVGSSEAPQNAASRGLPAQLELTPPSPMRGADRPQQRSRWSDELEQGRELEKAGQVDRAMNLFSTILRKDPENLEAHYALGSLYEKIGQHLQALEQFERANRVDPGNVDVMIRRANALAVLNRFEHPWFDALLGAGLFTTGEAVFIVIFFDQFLFRCIPF